jgi:hypothetical protein
MASYGLTSYGLIFCGIASNSLGSMFLDWLKCQHLSCIFCDTDGQRVWEAGVIMRKLIGRDWGVCSSVGRWLKTLSDSFVIVAAHIDWRKIKINFSSTPGQQSILAECGIHRG